MSDARERLTKFRTSPEFGVFQLDEYVHAFRGSSDRARYVIFITTAVSLLMLIAAWNYHQWSWSRRAKEEYFKLRKVEQEQQFAELRAERAKREKIDAILRRLETSALDRADATELRQAVLDAERAQRAETTREMLAAKWPRKTWLDHEYNLEWYAGQTEEFYGRGVFVPVPGLGSSLHVNDMALIGGLVLLALTALLWISLMRQHENLYLSLFKIESIRIAEGDEACRGDSISNLMYHTLAMAQVLSHPPTLARWNVRLRHAVLHRVGTLLVYFTPILVHGSIVGQNIRSREKAYAVWGADFANVRLSVQVLLAAGILIFCSLSFLYARSCELRWRKAFFQINRGLRRIEQRPWAEWVGLSEGDIVSKDLRRLARDLTYQLHIAPDDGHPTVRQRTGYRTRSDGQMDMRTHLPTIPGMWRCFFGMFHWHSPRLAITQREMARAVKYLFTQITGEQEERSRIRLRDVKVDENRLTMRGNKVKEWKVRITAEVVHPPAP